MPFSEAEKQEFIRFIERKAASSGRPVNPAIYKMSPGDLASRIRIVEMGAPSSLLYGDKEYEKVVRTTVDEWRKRREAIPGARPGDPPDAPSTEDQPGQPGQPDRATRRPDDKPDAPSPAPTAADPPAWYLNLMGPGTTPADISQAPPPILRPEEREEREGPSTRETRSMPRNTVQPSRIRFPDRGVNEMHAFSKQRPNTTRDAQNTRGHDPETGRNRGAQRAGLSKYLADQIDSAEIQDICHLTTSLS